MEKILTTITVFMDWGMMLLPYVLLATLVCLFPVKTNKGYRALVTRVMKGIF